MDALEWSPAMETGNPTMDAAHKAMFDAMESLLNGPDSDMDTGLNVLIEKLERDFREEELVMEVIGFPGIKPHREQHARVLKALHQLPPGDPVAAREALGLLPQWFQVHLATMDAVLAAAVNYASTPPEAVRNE
jgi:hemerythrin